MKKTFVAVVSETLTIEKMVKFQAEPTDDLENIARRKALKQLAVNEAKSGWAVVSSDGIKVEILPPDPDEELGGDHGT